MIKYINYGGADGVTGACHMLNTEFGNILLDCGLFQGRDRKIYSNLEMYFDPREVDAVVLSHAHIDHCGRIPILYEMGYRGKVYGTEATKLLSEIVLEESSKIFEEFSGESYKLFNLENVQMFLDNYVKVDYGKTTKILDNVFIELFDAGHLLGSASILVKIKDKSVFYSGDIGKLNTPILKDPEKITGADYAIIESTYGSLEKHESNEFFDEFKNIIINTLKRGGKCIIPSSTVGKMQEILYLINDIFEENDLKYKVYIDSPMSSKVVDIYEKCKYLYDEDAQEKLNNGDNPLDFTNLNYIITKEESIEIQENEEPYVVLSAGGMCEGGRVIYHLRKQIDNPKNSIILVGNQVHGTLGCRLSKGSKEIKIFKDKFKVKAEIYNFPSLSGHGDRNTIVDYVCSMNKKPKKIFLVHGDRKNQMDLRENLNFKNVEYTKFLKRYELK
ncbi:MBL fold metallo-hydrolase RNA specificity domain-containing protein [Candidatus Arthromitus sp. SFB-turkey]|uniref:MBL fold metallo-hydrolase RNA specificity domain-containing protein n=1 Tax=Candidatus Arthromitus sp. SFB-turkey TaxID=1840217 RepID=UPI0007F4F93A|nr:MBL fold metallo-hydrolase [Candidatus Arthromitus sp. SFB-turkey]OAT89673.1 MBL fold hydrolase [Candidatus Arthromitus sp. SFB-turkey]